MVPFNPDKLPLSKIDWVPLIELIGKANYNLAAFAGTLKGMVNPNVLLTPLTVREAVLSSKIEGTQATLQEVLNFQADPQMDNPRYDDIQEVINYRKALQRASVLLKEKPLNLNMIKTIHSVLLDSVRGQNRGRGNFRNIQNWIGKPGSSIEEAFYVPPAPFNLMEHLSNWEKYWHGEDKDRIVQLAVIHAQFEIIHPFLDGNGRIGRILIPLYLYEKGLLGQPVFYMSEYLEANRDEYYSMLRMISNNNEWNGWIAFFLKAFITQAENNRKKAEKIINLYEVIKREMHGLSTRYSFPALDTIFTMPIFNITDFIKFSGIPRASTHRLLQQLVGKKVLRVLKEGKGKTPGVFSFPQLMKITEMKDSSHA